MGDSKIAAATKKYEYGATQERQTDLDLDLDLGLFRARLCPEDRQAAPRERGARCMTSWKLPFHW